MKWKLIWFWIIGFSCWMVFLLYSFFTIEYRPALFFNAMVEGEASNVSSEYRYIPTTARYIFEPFVSGGYFYIHTSEIVYLMVGVYLIVRLVLFSATKKGSKDAKKYAELLIRLEKALNVYAGIIILIFFIVVAILLVGFAIAGFLFIGYYGFHFVFMLAWVSPFLFILTVGSGLYAYFKPDSKLGIKISSLKQQWAQKKRRRGFYDRLEKRKRAKMLLLEMKRLVLIGVVFGTLLIFLTTVRYPSRQIQVELDENEMLFDFHVHTMKSDGYMSPIDRVEWFRSHGINGAAFSDHHGINGALEAKRYVEAMGYDFTVIIAQEYSPSIPRTHLNIYGIEENINPYEYIPGLRIDKEGFGFGLFMNVSEMIAYVKGNGGYVTVNHYPRQDPFTWEQYRDWGVDGFEIVNGGSIQNPELTKFCLNNSLICMGGTDQHENSELDTFVKFRLDDPSDRKSVV